MASIIQSINEKVAGNEHLQQFISFGIIGASGAILNTYVLYVLTSLFSMHYLVAAAIATQLAIIVNFVGNNTITFKGRAQQTSTTKKFLTFEAVSLVGLAVTLAVLWAFTNAFGEELLLVWNAIAIVISFSVNFALNKLFTWRAAPMKTSNLLSKLTVFIVLATLALAATPAAHADDLVAVSQLGYHPSAHKQVVVYTSETSGTFTVGSFSGELVKPVDNDGNPTNCQGNLPCLIGDFTAFTTPGTYTVQTSLGTSPQFTISNNIYSSAAPVLMEFYKAQKQTGSPYHADMNTQQQPAFVAMADGSYILTADQAALTTIRLGSAYNRNPNLFGSELQNDIKLYTNYLISLQDATVTEGSGNARLRFGAYQMSAFTPLPGGPSTVDVYTEGGDKIQTLAVRALCEATDATCIAKATNVYKCQVGEVCLDRTYNDKVGTVTQQTGNYDVVRGWIYDWDCFVDQQSGSQFTTKTNPCLIFDSNTEERDESTGAILDHYVSKTILAYAEAIPAVTADSQAAGQALFDRTVATYNYMQATPATHDSAEESAFYGAAAFLLYDYTGNDAYLTEAHAQASKVNDYLVADHTRGSEFYWEEYARHKTQIQAKGLSYTPAEEIFRGKMFQDWKDKDFESISRNGERVFQLDSDIPFSNSRFMLTEGVQAAKTKELHPAHEDFVSVIADQQLAWLTGQNGVQSGHPDNPGAIKSYSFIFGIGNFPSQFHSRMLINTGHNAATSGQVPGAHGMGFKFKDADGQLWYFDGRTTIMGTEFGALGNGYNGEPKIEPYQTNTVFANGKNYIPGWINGAFDTKAENDIIYNYYDNLGDYRFTESTNEIVATAVEYLSYLDAQNNNKAPAPIPKFSDGGIVIPPAETDGALTITSTPSGADVLVAGVQKTTPATYTLPAGTYNVYVSMVGYNANETNITVISSSAASYNAALYPETTTGPTGSIDITSVPGSANVFVDHAPQGATDATGKLLLTSVPIGAHEITISKTNFEPYVQTINVNAGQQTSVVATLTPSVTNTGNQTNTTTPSTNATITSGTTSLTATSGKYYMLENETATFTAVTSEPATITWTASWTAHPDEGGAQKTVQLGTTTSGQALTYAPGVTITSKIVTVTITATAGSSTKTWTVDVEDLVNPYWEGDFGADTATIHVYTNDKLLGKASAVNVLLSSGQTVSLFTEYSNERESDWKQTLTAMPYGTTSVKTITVLNNASGKTYVFDVPSGVGHYRTEPRKERAASEKRSSARGGSGGLKAYPPELVYVVFGADVISKDDTQTITLDAKDDLAVKRAVATILGPDGYRTVELTLTEGTKGYGTWTAEFGDFNKSGQYNLTAITLWDPSTEPTEHEVTERSFYVVDDAAAAYQTLGLVYSVIDKSRVQANETVNITLDARDTLGVESIVASGVTSRKGNFTFNLTMVSGTPQYGTWKGSFTPSEPDTTYSITTLTLANKNETRVYTLKDRSVYVAAIPHAYNSMGAAAVPIFSKEGMRNLMKKPLVPTLIGFVVMILIIAIVTLNSGVRSKFKRGSRT